MTSKTILITGGATGFGKAAAIGMARNGHNIIATAQVSSQVTPLREEVAALGLSDKIRVERLDLTDPYDIKQAIKWDFDVLWNNAGMGEPGPVWEIPVDIVRRNYEVNVFLPLELTQGVVQRWVREGKAEGKKVVYRYKAGGSAAVLPVEDGAGRVAVVHVKALHPLDDHYGAGCLGAAVGAIAAHNAAAKWNAALLENAARPSGALVHDPGDKGMPLSAEQVDRLREELAESFAGGANAERPLLLEGGLKWQALSLSPAEMDFLALKDSSAREIAMAFGVPPMLLGLPGDATYANYREANRALWRLTVLPLCAKILGAVSQGLSGWFEGAELRVDLDKVPALAEDRMALWHEVSAADWLTADEKKALLGVA